MGLLALAACGGSDPPATSEAADDVSSATAAVRYDPPGAAGQSVRPAEDLVNPVGTDPAAAEQGAALFGTMNCDGCHGGGGLGFTAPSLVDGRWRYGGEDGALYHSIFYGRPNGMPAYGGFLSDATVWRLITYIRSRPLPSVVPTAAWPSPELAGDRP